MKLEVTPEALRRKVRTRFLRDLCGLTIEDCADSIGIRSQYWKEMEQHRRITRPTDEAVDFLEDRFDSIWEAAMDFVERAEEAFEKGSDVPLEYRRDGMPVPEGWTVRELNAVARIAAVVLMADGWEVEPVFPEQRTRSEDALPISDSAL